MGVFSRLAGGSATKILGIVLMVLTIIPAIFKACSVTVHQGEVAYLIWRGKAITHGHFMYPLRDFMRRRLRLAPLPRYIYPPRPRLTGRHWYVPILSRFQVENTANREHVTTTEFSHYDGAQDCEVVYTVEMQIVWGQIAQPIPNPFYVPLYLDAESMAIAMQDVEDKVGPLKGDIRRLVHEPYIYPWGALFNGVHYEALALGLMKAAVFDVYSDPEFPVREFRKSNTVFGRADEICSNRLLLLYASEFRELHLSDVKPVPMQTGQIASSIRSLRPSTARPLHKSISAGFGRVVAALFKTG